MTLVLLVEALRSGSLVVVGTLLRASLEAAVVAAIVWGVCRSAPRLPAAVRVWLWWLVSAKLLLGLAPLPGVPLPVLPTAVFTWNSPVATTDIVIPTASSVVARRTVPAPAVSAVDQPAISIPYASLWPLLLVIVWCGITGVYAVGLARALRNARHLRRHAEPAHATVITRLAQLVRAFGSPVMPGVFASRHTSVPLLTGIVRPAILLPAASTPALSRLELDLVLGHEIAHVRRGDLAWGWVPAIASRMFFFDPLARFAAREYLAAREEACDAEVLQTLDAAPAEYGQLIVKLGVATTDDVLAAAGSSPTFALLKRRLIMLDRSRTPASRWWWTLAGATAVLLPLTLAAQPAPPAPPEVPAAPVAPRAYADAWVPPPPAPPEPPPAPDAPEAESPVFDEVVDVDEVPPVPPVPPAPSVAPLPPMPSAPAVWAVPPAPPAPPAPPRYQENRYGSARHNDTPWVLLEPDNRNVMSGSRADKAAAERYRRSTGDTLLWFRYKGKEYVSYDPATIQAVRDAFGPVNAVGEEMGRVGGRMGAQGGKQGEIGARQGELGARQAELAALTTKIAAEQAARRAAEAAAMAQARAQIAQSERTAASDAERQARREQMRLEGEQMRQEQRAERARLEAEMKALGEQQRALGDEMRKLGAGMEVHSAEMKHLSGKMEEALAAAQARVASLFDSAVASGKARAVP